MENRLNRITTRSGDQGETGLADGSRLPKWSPRCEAMGDVDELNAQIGLWRARLIDSELPLMGNGDDPEPDADATAVREAVLNTLRDIQDELFDLGGGLSMPGHCLLNESSLSRLDAEIERLNAGLEPLREFVIPGGSQLLGQAHVVRTVARRAERRVALLSHQESEHPEARAALERSLRYLNRLSDWAFVAGRALAVAYGTPQPQWRGPSARG